LRLEGIAEALNFLLGLEGQSVAIGAQKVASHGHSKYSRRIAGVPGARFAEERSAGRVQLWRDPRQRVRDETGRLVHDRDDIPIGHAARAYHPEDAEDLPTIGIGRGDEAALAHLLHRVLPADHNLYAALLGHARQEGEDPRLVLEGLEEAPHGAHVAEIRMIQHVDGAADIEIAVAEEAADLLEEAAMARPQRVERISRPLHVVENGLEGLAPIAAGAGGGDAARPPRAAPGGGGV